MKVRKLIVRLQRCDQEQEVRVEPGNTTERTLSLVHAREHYVRLMAAGDTLLVLRIGKRVGDFVLLADPPPWAPQACWHVNELERYPWWLF